MCGSTAGEVHQKVNPSDVLCVFEAPGEYTASSPLTESDLAEGQIQTMIRNLSPYSAVYGQLSKKHLLTNLPWQMGRRVLVCAGLSNFSCSQHISSLFFTTLTVELITISRLMGQDTGCSSLCWPSSKLSSSLWNEHLHSPLKDSFLEQFTHTSSKWGTEENKLLMSGCLHV